MIKKDITTKEESKTAIESIENLTDNQEASIENETVLSEIAKPKTRTVISDSHQAKTEQIQEEISVEIDLLTNENSIFMKDSDKEKTKKAVSKEKAKKKAKVKKEKQKEKENEKKRKAKKREKAKKQKAKDKAKAKKKEKAKKKSKSKKKK